MPNRIVDVVDALNAGVASGEDFFVTVIDDGGGTGTFARDNWELGVILLQSRPAGFRYPPFRGRSVSTRRKAPDEDGVRLAPERSITSISALRVLEGSAQASTSVHSVDMPAALRKLFSERKRPLFSSKISQRHWTPSLREARHSVPDYSLMCEGGSSICAKKRKALPRAPYRQKLHHTHQVERI